MQDTLIHTGLVRCDSVPAKCHFFTGFVVAELLSVFCLIL